MMKRWFAGTLLAGMVLGGALAGEAEEQPAPREITPPPAAWMFHPFYAKHIDADGFPVICSAKVSDEGLREAVYLIDRMLAGRDDIRQALVENRIRFVVMAPDEMTTDVPEHSDLTPKEYWDRRARGLGPTHERPAVSCGEENLLCLPGDRYPTENILVHEFAHAMHLMGLNTLDDAFEARLRETYEQALAQKLWEGKYAATNKEEYWAEGVQSYFDTNRPPDHDHNHVDTREELAEYDPGLHALIDEVFGGNPWRYLRPADRAAE